MKGEFSLRLALVPGPDLPRPRVPLGKRDLLGRIVSCRWGGTDGSR